MALILSGLVIAGSLRTVTCNKAALLECVVLILSRQLVVKLIMGNTYKKSEFINGVGDRERTVLWSKARHKSQS